MNSNYYCRPVSFLLIVIAFLFTFRLFIPDIAHTCDDLDGDGFIAGATLYPDCNDYNNAVYPGAPEVCDSIDNDCDGLIDDGECGEVPVYITIDAVDEAKVVDRTANGRLPALGSIITGHPVSNGAFYHIDGSGVWDIENHRPKPEVIKHARDLGISYVRYILGNWTHETGPVEQRPKLYYSENFVNNHEITFGLPEGLHLIDEIDAIPVLMFPIYSPAYNFSVQDAENLMIYLFSPCDAPSCTTEINNIDEYNTICVNSNVYNSGNSSNWPQVRVCDKYALGRTDLDTPWNVTWFEFGNETLGCTNSNKQDVNDCIVSFSSDYSAFRSAMLSINPNIKLGATIEDSTWYLTMGLYGGMVQGTGPFADFYIPHIYIPWYTTPWDNFPPYDLIKYGLAGTGGQLNNKLQSLNSFISEMNEGFSVPMAVTEYDSWFHNTDLHHSLGHALMNAEFVRQFMHADNIALGTGNNFTYLVNTNGPGTTEGPFTVRPLYYSYQLYNHFFGDVLLNADVHVDAYDINEYKYKVEVAEGEHQDRGLYDDALAGILWTIENPQPEGSGATQENGILTVDFNGMNNEYSHSYMDTTLDPDTLYRLSGFLKTSNITSSEGVYLAIQSGDDLIMNGDFEDPVLNYWDAMGGIPLSLDFNTVRSGDQSLRMDLYTTESFCDTGWLKGTVQNNIEVSPNTTYTYEGYMKTDNVTFCPSSAFGMRFRVYDASNSSSLIWSGTLPEGSTDWTHFSIQFTTPANTTSVNLQIMGQKLLSGTVWVDDVRFAAESTAKDVYGASTFNGTEGTEYSWSYVTADFRTPPDTASTRVFVGRRKDGTPASGTAMFKDVKLRKYIPENHGAVPYLSVNASKSANGKKLYLMVLNKDLNSDIQAPISLVNFYPVSAKKWTLTAEFADSTNENGDDVNVVFEDIGDFSNADVVTFPKHSLTALVLNSEATPAGWYDNDWTGRQKLVISSDITDADLTDFPVLIKITDQDNPVFDEAQVDADDILFTSADGVTKLDHEIEYYQDRGTKVLEAWVRIPLLSATDDKEIFMYYGNRETMGEGNPNGVWNDSFTVVQHMNEIRNSHKDSTSNQNDSTLVRVTGQGDTSVGKIGGADEFDGINDKVLLQSRLRDIMNLTDNVGTMSTWLKPTGSPVAENTIYYLPPALGDNWGSTGISIGEYDSDGDTLLENKIWAFNGNCILGADYTADEWVYITWLKTGDSLHIYKNGVESDSEQCTALGDGFLNVGHSLDADNEGGFFKGMIDEVRVSNAARSAEWIMASYRDQSDPESYLTYDMVMNGGFEDSVLNYWDAMGGIPLSLDLNTVHSGNQSLRMDLYTTESFCDTGWLKGAVQNNVAVRPNTTYTYEGYMKTDNVTFCPSNAWGLRFRVYDASNSRHLIWSGTLPEGSTDWTHFSIQFTTPANTTSVNLQIMGQKLLSGTVWVDDVKLILNQ
jgi:alpha-L-arabinofuranosidase